MFLYQLACTEYGLPAAVAKSNSISMKVNMAMQAGNEADANDLKSLLYYMTYFEQGMVQCKNYITAHPHTIAHFPIQTSIPTTVITRVEYGQWPGVKKLRVL